MEVILLERIERLGQMGDVVTVKPGYARNYLLPQKKALRATDGNKQAFEVQRTQLEAVNLSRRGEAEQVGAKLDGTTVVLIRQAGEAGQLYGSVNARDVMTAVTEVGFTIERSQVILHNPIKSLGLHPVLVSLHPEVKVTVTANVARSEEEAEIQAKTGKALIGRDDEDDVVEAAPAPEAAAEKEASSEEATEEGVEEEGAEEATEEAAEEKAE
jgi:large subunit ribosomal protein L9